MLRSICSILLLFCSFLLQSQDNWDKGKLLSSLKHPIADTTRLDVYNELSWPVYSYDLPDSALYYGKMALALADSLHDQRRLCIAHRRVGITYSNTGDLKASVQHQETSLKIAEAIGWERGQYLALNNLGVAYQNKELSKTALTYYLKALRFIEGTNQHADLAKFYNNCGALYRRIGNLNKAKEYYLKVARHANLAGDNDLLLSSNCNLASAYRQKGQLDSASIFLEKGRSFLSEKSSRNAQFDYYINEANLLVVKNQPAKALLSLEKAKESVANFSDRVNLDINFAEQYVALHQYEKAISYYKLAFEQAKTYRMFDALEYSCKGLAELYETEKALPQYAAIMKLYVAYRDSNEMNNKAQDIVTQQMEFDFEIQRVADSVHFEQREKMTEMELQVAEAKLDREKIMRVLLIIGLVVFIILAYLINTRLRLTKKQKLVIEEQKKLVDVKNKEILDSIRYAKRLQAAILPQTEKMRSFFKFDLLYQPKDVIGGDFYFYEEFRDKIFVAVCDCTGHGVPGAMMSVVCHQALFKAIREFELTEPAAILERCRQSVVEHLNAASLQIFDGMDASLLVFDKKKNQVAWAGAFAPLCYVADGNLHEIKADKQPVAYHQPEKPFTQHVLPLKKGMSFYLFTDGYSDQFGGDKGKKFKYRSLKNFFAEHLHLSVAEQIRALRQNFENWKGELEQVDDVTVAILRY